MRDRLLLTGSAPQRGRMRRWARSVVSPGGWEEVGAALPGFSRAEAGSLHGVSCGQLEGVILVFVWWL